jgi:Ca2+-binding RTX toxin-like protein
VLIGYVGADTFAFTTLLGNGNVDTLFDFTAGTDKIGLSAGIFAAVGSTLDAAEFVVEAAALSTDQRIVYDAGTGQLFYDADGSGKGAAILFAQGALGSTLSASDFVMIPPAAAAV